MVGFVALLSVIALAQAQAQGRLVPVPGDRVTDRSHSARKVALLVGVPGFEDTRWPALRFTTSDVETMASALSGFEVIRQVRSEDTTRAAVLDALNRLSSDLTRTEDTLLVYLSTHGTLGRAGAADVRRFIVTSDTRKDLVEQTGLGVSEVLAAMGKVRSRRKALVLALCHSGQGKSALNDELTRALAGRKSGFFLAPVEDVSSAMVVLSAASWGEPAIEDDVLGGDVYTHYLVEGIQANDLDRDGAVTITEAHEFARERVYYHTKGVQRPSIEMLMQGTDPIVLRGRKSRAGRPVLYSYAESSRGMSVWIDGRLKGTLPATFAVDSGALDLELKSAQQQSLYRGRVVVVEGQSVALQDLIPPLPSWDVMAVGGYRYWFDGVVRERALPSSPTVGLEVRSHDLMYPGGILGLRFRAAWGEGSLPGGTQSVSFDTTAWAVGASFGHGFLPWRFLMLSGALAGEVFLVQRETVGDFDNRTGYHASHQALGGGLLLPLAMEFLPLPHLRAGILVEPGLSWLQIDRVMEAAFSLFAGVTAGATF